MTLADHLAPHGEERKSAESESFGAQECCHNHISPGSDATIGLQDDLRSHAFGHQSLMCLSDAQLPRRAGMFDRHQRRGPGTTLRARDGDHVGIGLGDAASDGAHSGLAHQLDRYPGGWLESLQVVDQLGEIFDRVDVVVWRW